ncbi:MAG: hypothetical protein WD058_03365 [Dehalococcoidia bacterium]
MRSCEDCGTPVHATWEYCRRCGAELPALPAPAPRTFPRPRLPSVAALRGLRPRARRVTGVTGGAAGGAMLARLGRARASMVPAWTLVAAVGVLSVVAFAFALALALGGGPDTSAADLEAARLVGTQAQGEAERLTGDLAAAHATETGLREEVAALDERLADAEEELAGGEGDREALESTVVGLRQQVDEASTELTTQEETIEVQESQIATLFECLSGLEVAVAFFSEGREDLVDRALEAVDDACDAVEGFRDR